MRLVDVVGRLDDHAGTLGVALARWAYRDTAADKAGARRAANTAITELDAILAECHAARAQLISEIKVSDDATAKRVDELIAERRRDGAT